MQPGTINKKKEPGKRFKNNLKTERKEITKNPFTRSFRSDDVPYAVVKKFPYAAHYTVDEEKHVTIIHAVFGCKETPEKWEEIRI